MALPKIPPEPAPFTIVEYFTDPNISGFHDPRHHAVSLAFVVPVSGDCQPSQQALDLGWYTPEQAISSEMRLEMTGGHDRLVRLHSHRLESYRDFCNIDFDAATSSVTANCIDW